MKKRYKSLVIKLFISLFLAYVLIILSSVFFFRTLLTTTSQSQEAIQLFKNNIDQAFTLETHIFNFLEHVKTHQNQYYSEEEDIQAALLKDKISDSFRTLTEDDLLYDIKLPSFLALKSIVENTLAMNPATTKIENNFQSLMDIKEATNLFIEDILAKRESIALMSMNKLHNLKYVILGVTFLGLLIILFIFYNIILIMRRLKELVIEEAKLNQEFLSIQKHLQSNNWILDHSSSLNEKISGIDSEATIAQYCIDNIDNALNVLASTIYIRKMDSFEFLLKADLGVKNIKNTPKTFLEGEGILGKVAKSKKRHILQCPSNTQTNNSTSLISNIESQIIIQPLIYESRTLGVLEIECIIDTENEDRNLQYLERVSKIIGTAIQFGQSHTLVERLLSETQRQAEVLGSQQEELRVANSELVIKTDLLESSKEELRFQQRELKQINMKLNEKARELERRNQDLREAQKIVEQKVEEAESSNKYKSEFLANMSHELRTPLNSILVLTNLLKDNKDKNLNPDQIKYASIIHSAGTDLLQLINEILDLAKIEAGKLEVNPGVVNIYKFISNCEVLFEELATLKDIHFKTEIHPLTPVYFISDGKKVEQILKNFLSNAFKFTPTGGKITVHLFFQKNTIYFQVADNGIGIAKEKQELIFEAFRQEDGSTNRKYGGTGLGLSISKKIASLLGGEIILESKINKGSTFTFALPYIPIDDSKKNNIIKSNGNTFLSEWIPLLTEESTDATPSILIIDNDVNFAETLTQFAIGKNYNAFITHDGVSGIKKALEITPKAIILDLMLPLKDGWKVLEELKKNVKTQNIPIHVLSSAPFEAKAVTKKGAVSYTVKPLSQQDIKVLFKNIEHSIRRTLRTLLVIDLEKNHFLIEESDKCDRFNIIQSFNEKESIHMLNEAPALDYIILNIQSQNNIYFKIIEAIHVANTSTLIVNIGMGIPVNYIKEIQNCSPKAIILQSESKEKLIKDLKSLFSEEIKKNKDTDIAISSSIPHNVSNDYSFLKDKSILIVDDDMRNVYALSSILQKYDLNIDIAYDGIEAVEAVDNAKYPFDIVLMDIMMPRMDGIEAIKKIRSKSQYDDLPIIAITAKAMTGDKELLLNIGASDYLSKPIDIDKLFSKIKKWVATDNKVN